MSGERGGQLDVSPEDLALLFEPLQVGSVTLPNRIFVSAHEGNFGRDRLMGDRYVEYLAERARGGAGLVMPGGAAVHPEGEHIGHLPIWWDECIPGYTKLADAVHRYDSNVFVQLFHCGIQDDGVNQLTYRHAVRGPSDVASPIFRLRANPLTAEDITDTVEHYGRSAANMRQAGIDGVEVGAGHGYLVCQFLSPLTNRRTDDYGGTLENRCRLLREIATEIRARVGDDYPVGARMSFDEFVGPTGITPEDSEAMLAHIRSWGLLDFINVTSINYHSLHRLTIHMAADVGAQFAPYSKRAKRVLDGEIPVFVASGVRTIDQAVEVLRNEEADLVGMTRAHIADPEVVSKARSGRIGEIRRCVGANQGCVRQSFSKSRIYCTVNPVAAHETDLGRALAEQSSEPCSVLVVGGGPGGLKAAQTAARRGHSVTLWERETYLGGMLHWAAELPVRHRWNDVIADLTGSLERHGVGVEVGREATAAAVAAHGADVVILATGSSYDRSGFMIQVPGLATIAGLQSGHVIDPVEALADIDAIGQNVVIVDGNGEHTPVSLAILLAEGGRNVEVVSPQLHVGTQMVLTFEFPWVYQRAADAGVRLTPQSYVSEVRSDGVTVESVWGFDAPRRTPADTVILSQLRTPNDALYKELVADGDVNVHPLGDCLAPRDADDAIEEGVRIVLRATERVPVLL